jgi:hypothetical protein
MRTGIYIDFDNVASNGLGSIQFGPLRSFFEASGLVSQCHVYLAQDEKFELDNPKYTAWRRGCRNRMEAAGFRVHTKPMKAHQAPDGTVTCKGNVDVELTVDVMLHSDRLDRVVLLTGDGDFCRLVEALQDKGIHVDVMGALNVSNSLIKQANRFFNPLLIPGVAYAQDAEFKRVFAVQSFDLREMEAEILYLADAPKSLSPADPAWMRERMRLSRIMYESRRFIPGRVLGWTGADGLEAYRDIA